MFDGLAAERDPSGVYARWNTGKPEIFAGKPALFIDRDGVLVEETNYLHRPEDVSLIPGVGHALSKLNQARIPVIIVTNQAGIGRGYYGWKEFIRVQNDIYYKLKTSGAHIDACVACPYHSEGLAPYRYSGHFFRKPNPGMLLWAAQTSGINLNSSWIVGDKLSDLQAGEKAGLAGLAHVLTGHGAAHRPKVLEWAKGRPNILAVQNLCEAIDSFLQKLLDRERMAL